MKKIDSLRGQRGRSEAQAEVTDENSRRVGDRGMPSLAHPSLRMPVDLDDEIWRQALRYAFVYALIGLVLGLACILGGLVLFLHGVTGSTNWVASAVGLHSSVNDAAPGTMLFVVGLFVVFITRYNVKISRRSDNRGQRGKST